MDTKHDRDTNNANEQTGGKGFSRRQFLIGGAATGALTMAGLAGCSNEASVAADDSAADTPETSNDLFTVDAVGEPTETITADIAIIGAGGSGLSAAIQAAQMGLNPVILEKMNFTGGSYVCTEGVYLINNKYQAEQGISYDIDECIREQMDYHHWVTSPALLKSYYHEINETIDWCDDLGVTFNGLLDMGKNPGMVLVWKHDPENTLPGALAANALASGAEKLGIDIRRNTPVKQIIMEDGKVVGVLAQGENGEVLKVEAPAVIIATGGYARNPEMVAELGNFRCKPYDVGMAGRDGDGIKMGLDAGARMWDYPGTSIVSGPVVLGAEWATLPVLLCLNPLLYLNQDCQRFIREDLINVNFTFLGNASMLQKRLFVVFTQKDLDHFENVGPYSRVFSLIYEGTPMTGITDILMDIKEEEGSVYIADTLEDLAAEADLDAAALQETIATYNTYCAEGTDPEFGKRAEYLNPLEEGPYYALECGNVFYGTTSSLTVTPECECVDDNFEVIPGLYAAGSDAGGLYGDSYDANLAPCSLAGWALNSGRLAAKNAEKYLKG